MDNLKVVEELYSKSYTSILRVYDKPIKKTYILKKMNIDNMSEEMIVDVREIFNRETKALKKINHPNVIKYIKSSVNSDGFFLFTEDTPGMVSIDKKNLSYTVIKKLEIFEQILEGIKSCHSSKVLHRDIKPSNILISKNGDQIKIIDFGLSKVKDIFDENSGVTVKDYMSCLWQNKSTELRNDLVQNFALIL